MIGHTTTIAYSTVIFLALALGGLTVLQRQRAVGTRIIVFLLFVAACVFVTSWTTKRWQLLMGEATIAWIVALLIVAILTAIIRARRIKGTTDTA